MQVQRKPILLITLFISLAPFYIAAQKTYYVNGLNSLALHWEIGITAGANQFLGDLGGTPGTGKGGLKDYVFNVNRLLGGIGVTYNLNNYSAVNLSLNLGSIFGADSLIRNNGEMERWRYNRNLSFKSNVLEVAGTFTWYPLLHLHHNTVQLYRLNPFVEAGVGLMHFNPKAKLGDRWYALHPLRLEGENFTEYPGRKPYSLTKIFIPVNFGLKYYFSNTLGLSAGIMSRISFTDYMDDISTTYIDPALFDKYLFPENAAIAKQLYSRSRTPWKVKPDIAKADPTDKDTYLTFFFKLSFRLDKYEGNCRSHNFY